MSKGGFFPPFFNAMNKLPPIKALILDMDGVLWRGNQPIGDLPAIFAEIKARQLKVTLATNNSTRTAEQHLEKVKGFGVALDVTQILSSSMATAAQLKEDFPNGGDVYVIGHEGITTALEHEGFRVFQEDAMPANPVAVVSGIDWEIDYKKIANAATLVRNGAPFYGTNPDKTFPTPNGLMPGAGTILAAIDTASGVAPIISGKPEPYLLQLAMRRMGVLPNETLMVGDRLETDVLGGQNAGCFTAQVLTGVSTRAEGEAIEKRPDIIADDLRAVLDLV